MAAARTPLHIGLSLLGAVLYVLFVIPRWWVLTGDFPAPLATAGRIAAGFPIGLAAIPVALTLQQSLKAEPRIPELALRLRAWSAVLHVVAGVLIVTTAVAEIWLTADRFGPWLYAVYGAAGAIAILAVLGFYMSFIAEQPPGPPKPAKPAKTPRTKKQRGRKAEAETAASAEESPDEAAEEEPENDEPAPTGGLRNKRPTGKSRLRR